MHKVFTQDTFYDEFSRDLSNAKHLVLLQSPFLGITRINKMERLLRNCVRRGVSVCIFAQDTSSDVSKQVEVLRCLGGHLTFRPRIHEKLAIIDETIFWEGSLNILSHYNSFERMTRWVNREKVFDAISRHSLICEECGLLDVGDAVGRVIAKRRKMLRISQAELARRVGLKQSVISEIETGKRDIQLSTLQQVGQGLSMQFRAFPWFMLPALHRQLDDH